MVFEEIGFPNWFFVILLILGFWELIWKGLALWQSAQKKQLTWFIFILILNTVGILPIIYLIIHCKRKNKKNAKTKSL